MSGWQKWLRENAKKKAENEMANAIFWRRNDINIRKLIVAVQAHENERNV
jgi:hypothetical protein